MTLILELPPEVEGALAAEARQKGTTPEHIALDRLRQQYFDSKLPVSPPPILREDPTLALFAQWEAEYATTDPAELARHQVEGDELMASLAANRINFEGRTDFTDLL